MDGKENTTQPSDEDLRKCAQDLILEQNTLTLATAKADTAWAAPIYYVSDGFKFYFFSNPTSRHIQESVENRQVSAAVFAQASTWTEIRGIQMSGTVKSIPPGVEAFRVLRAYLKKYPFTKEFFGTDQHVDLDAVVKKFRVKLYQFLPSLIFYLDNRISFGFRESILPE